MPDTVLVEEAVAVPATPAHLAALHEALDRFWAATCRALAASPEREGYLQFATAAMEIANNIARHAYPDPGEAGTVELRLRAYPDRIEARFTDRGVAYTPPIATPRAPLDDDLDVLDIPEGGYGMALVRAAVDRVDHCRTAEGLNRWRLMKRLPRPSPGTAGPRPAR